MIIGGAFIFALLAMFVVSATDRTADCAHLLTGWRKVCTAICCGVLVQALLLPMLPGFLFALLISLLSADSDPRTLEFNSLCCNTILYGQVIYYYLGRTHRRRQAKSNYNPLP